MVIGWLIADVVIDWSTEFVLKWLIDLQEFGCSVPDPQTLVNISQSRCSASDLTRMEGILAAKLGDQVQPIVNQYH